MIVLDAIGDLSAMHSLVCESPVQSNSVEISAYLK